MDVDGTLTDGKIYMGSEGELFKAFDIKDGAGIREILPMYGICPVIITARESKIVWNRCSELNIVEVYQGVREKFKKLTELLDIWSYRDKIRYTLKDVAYIGDDIMDLQCMKPLQKAGGIIGCPADAIDEVKEICDYVSERDGGDGAVREFIRWLVKQREVVVM